MSDSKNNLYNSKLIPQTKVRVFHNKQSRYAVQRLPSLVCVPEGG